MHPSRGLSAVPQFPELVPMISIECSINQIPLPRENTLILNQLRSFREEPTTRPESTTTLSSSDLRLLSRSDVILSMVPGSTLSPPYLRV